MNDEIQFIENYKNALSTYKKYRKDFTSVNLMHLKFVRDNDGLSKEIFSAKLKKLINLYTNQINIQFSKDIYSECSFVWNNVGQYIDSNIWLCIDAIESKTDEDSIKLAKEYYSNIQIVVDKLRLNKISVYERPINKITDKLEIQIKNMRR